MSLKGRGFPRSFFGVYMLKKIFSLITVFCSILSFFLAFGESPFGAAVFASSYFHTGLLFIIIGLICDSTFVHK